MYFTKRNEGTWERACVRALRAGRDLVGLGKGLRNPVERAFPSHRKREWKVEARARPTKSPIIVDTEFGPDTRQIQRKIDATFHEN